jgi:hypothetical protein
MRPDELIRPFWTYIALRQYSIDPAFLHPLFMEFVLWAVVSGVAAVLLGIRPRLIPCMEGVFKRLGRHRVLSVVVVGVVALGVRAALLPLIPIPEPVVHDEYSYILQAETFAAGRVTNPPHPLWIHFETFHVNMLPTYQSMYPPAHASFMALGQLLFGHPWWGIWLSVGLMCAAVTWMLQGWMHPKWAVPGGLLCVLRFGIFSYWINSYFGGAVPALGGALLMGALPRLMKKQGRLNAAALALGLLILANSRPYEGFLFSAPVVAFLAVWLIRKHPWRRPGFRGALAVAAAMLICGAMFMAYYNWRCTGSPKRMPYVVNQETYHITKPLLWQTAYPIPEYHHPAMRQFYLYQELPNYFMSRARWGLIELAKIKLLVYYEYYIWPLLLLVLPTLWVMLKSQRMRLLAITVIGMLCGLLLESWHPQGHYAAPITCVWIAVTIYGIRLVRTWSSHGLPAGVAISRAIVLVLLAWLLVPISDDLLNPWRLIPGRGSHLPYEVERARLQTQLQAMPGQQLVIVRHRLGFSSPDDWVYNKPDIDHAKVVWARDMGWEKNDELVRYFANRRIWFVDEDDGIMRLEAYNGHNLEDMLASAGSTVPVSAP